MESTRQKDYIVEQNVGKFMDNYFWTKVANVKHKTFERVHDKERQYQGIDILIGDTAIDEKAKVKNCLNRILEYPSFELEHISRNGDIVDGWFIKPTLTNYYAYIAVYTSVDSEYEITTENIDHLNVMLVKKSDVKSFISQYDSKKNILTGIDYLRSHDYERRYRFSHGKYWLTISRQYQEQPINLVMTRDLLKSFETTKSYNIYNNRIERA